jgi:hypothetical protein
MTHSDQSVEDAEAKTHKAIVAGLFQVINERRFDELGEYPIRSSQLRSAWLPPLQDGELVAQDQDLGGLPGLITP